MKVQIVVDGEVVTTQIVSETLYPPTLSLRQAKLIALRAAIEERNVKNGEELWETFSAFDTEGIPIEDEEWSSRY